jgi:pimeloyl-ACP methyl ester carboxylesterase
MGGAGEVVLLLHAGVADRSMWREHLGWLAEAGFKAVAVDLPGFGDTLVTPGVQAPWEDVLQTLKELSIVQAALVGNSFGAAVALRIAAVAPVAVSRLMLVSPPPLKLDPSPVLAAAWQAEETALERDDIEGAVAAVLDAWLQPAAPVDLRERIGTMQRRAFQLQGAAPDVQKAPDPLVDHPEVLEHLQIPVLAAAGEADMPDFKAGAAEIAELVPHGQVTMIPGAGHLAPLEAPNAFRELLLHFLGAETDPRSASD